MSQVNEINDPQYTILFEPLPVKQKVKRIPKVKVVNPVQDTVEVSTADTLAVELYIDQGIPTIIIPANEICVNDSIACVDAIHTMVSENQTDYITPHNLLCGLINKQKLKEDKQDIWKNSPYKDLVKLQ